MPRQRGTRGENYNRLPLLVVARRIAGHLRAVAQNARRNVRWHFVRPTARARTGHVVVSYRPTEPAFPLTKPIAARYLQALDAGAVGPHTAIPGLRKPKHPAPSKPPKPPKP